MVPFRYPRLYAPVSFMTLSNTTIVHVPAPVVVCSTRSAVVFCTAAAPAGGNSITCVLCVPAPVEIAAISATWLGAPVNVYASMSPTALNVPVLIWFEAIAPPSVSPPFTNGPAVTFSSDRLKLPAVLTPLSSITIVQVPVAFSWKSSRSPAYVCAACSPPPGG